MFPAALSGSCIPPKSYKIDNMRNLKKLNFSFNISYFLSNLKSIFENLNGDRIAYNRLSATTTSLFLSQSPV
jgi:hypothetical protein